MAKISVIVPVYNVEKYLDRCLESLINQSFQDIEIICINDGSTDKSLNILKTYSSKDKRIQVYSLNNLGVSAARNLGLKYASGEYIGFVDSDDYIDKDFFEKLYAAAIENNSDIACGNIIRENHKKKRILVEYDTVSVKNNTKEKYEAAGIPAHCYIWNKIYKREALVKSNIKFVEGKLFEDMIFSPDIIEALGSLVTVPQVFYHYWINKQSIVTTPTDRNRNDAIEANKYLMKKCKKYNISGKNINLISKNEYFFLGLKILKVYEYHATKIYSLFGILPILQMRSR